MKAFPNIVVVLDLWHFMMRYVCTVPYTFGDADYVLTPGTSSAL